MYLNLNAVCTVREDEVVGIFDLDTCTAGRRGKRFLPDAQTRGELEAGAETLPLSFAVLSSKGTDRVVLSPASAAAVRRRAESRFESNLLRAEKSSEK